MRQTTRALTPKEVRSPEIINLIEYMRETLRDAPGVGLAAPQIGQSLNLAVIEDRVEYHKAATDAELKERERMPVDFHVLVNPQIESMSDAQVSFFEGCLSLPGFMAEVPRSRSDGTRAFCSTRSIIYMAKSTSIACRVRRFLRSTTINVTGKIARQDAKTST